MENTNYRWRRVRIQNGTKMFKDKEEFIDTFEAYLDHIKDEGFKELPTKTNYAKWFGCARRTVYNTISSYPGIEEEFREILAETLTEGAIAGQYDKTMTIFALKNWCNWSDKRESTNITKTKADKVATPEEAKAKVIELVKNERMG